MPAAPEAVTSVEAATLKGTPAAEVVARLLRSLAGYARESEVAPDSLLGDLDRVYRHELADARLPAIGRHIADFDYLRALDVIERVAADIEVDLGAAAH